MNEYIDESLSHLRVDIDLLKPLPGNPRKGNLAAIRESYSRFGQLKPIVAIEDGDGTFTVIAGNHQLQAAKEMGWEQIAVATVSLDKDDAIAFALTDNKVSELGSTDNKALIEILSEMDINNPLMDALGWDEFAIAAIENSVFASTHALKPNEGWVAPQIVSDTFTPTSTESSSNAGSVGGTATSSVTPISENGAVSVTTDTPTSSIVTQGSTATSMSGTKNAAIQFTLVFEDPSQQHRWYSFLRWLKSSPVYNGETTSERLLDFIETHSQGS